MELLGKHGGGITQKCLPGRAKPCPSHIQVDDSFNFFLAHLGRCCTCWFEFPAGYKIFPFLTQSFFPDPQSKRFSLFWAPPAKTGWKRPAAELPVCSSAWSDLWHQHFKLSSLFWNLTRSQKLLLWIQFLNPSVWTHMVWDTELCPSSKSEIWQKYYPSNLTEP